MKKQRNKKIFGLEMDLIWPILLVLWVVLIYGHSLTPADLSSKESGWVMNLALDILHIFGSEGEWVTSHIIRKSAHFFEYFVFGLLLMQNFHCIWKNSGRSTGWQRRGNAEKFLPLVLAVLAVPFCDETIQLFVPGRAGQIPDVWLDISGAVCGILLHKAAGFLFGCLRVRCPHRRRSSTSLHKFR